MDEDVQEMLYQLAFDEVSPREKLIFDQLGKHYKAGEIIVKEGDNSSQLFLIVKGSVKIVKNYQKEDEKAIAILSDDQIFGEMSYFDDMPRSASVVAAVDTDLLVLDKEHFDMLFQIHPKWTTNTIKALAQRIYLAYVDIKIGTDMLTI